MRARGGWMRIGASMAAVLAGCMLGALLLAGAVVLTAYLVEIDHSVSVWAVRAIASIFVACAVASACVVALLVRAMAVRLGGYKGPSVGAALALFGVASIITYIVASDYTYCATGVCCDARAFPFLSDAVFESEYCTA